jgi:transporter family-2 protein
MGAAVLGGVCATTQGTISGALSAEVGDGITAAMVAFVSGAPWFVLIFLSCRSARFEFLRAVREVRSGGLRWWELIGGACGAIFVTVQCLAVGPLGVGVFFVAVVAGQSVSSIVVEGEGLLVGGRRPITAMRLLSALLIVAGAIIASVGRGAGGISPLLALPIVAGALLAVQQALNGRINARLSAAAQTETAHPPADGIGRLSAVAVWNLLAGFPVMLIVFLVSRILKGWTPICLPGNALLYIGGLLGILFVSLQTVAVGRLGVLLLGLGITAGQLLSGAVIDGLTGGTILVGQIVGTGIAFIAVGLPVVAAVLRGRRVATSARNARSCLRAK